MCQKRKVEYYTASHVTIVHHTAPWSTIQHHTAPSTPTHYPIAPHISAHHHKASHSTVDHHIVLMCSTAPHSPHCHYTSITCRLPRHPKRTCKLFRCTSQTRTAPHPNPSSHLDSTPFFNLTLSSPSSYYRGKKFVSFFLIEKPCSQLPKC